MDNKAFDIIDARCNHEDEIFKFVLLSHFIISFYITMTASVV